jgi:hypothetical protein
LAQLGAFRYSKGLVYPVQQEGYTLALLTLSVSCWVVVSTRDSG